MSVSDLCIRIPRNKTAQPRYFKNRFILFCLPTLVKQGCNHRKDLNQQQTLLLNYGIEYISLTEFQETKKGRENSFMT